MSESPLISVIMPFYNTPATFMAEAIESVLSQTYDNWELLIVNDGSTAVTSTETARRYATAHRAKVHHLTYAQPANRGPGAARQLALRHARGSLVALLDADDLWLPDKLKEQVALLNQEPEAGALYGNTLYWYSWNTTEKADFQPVLGLRDKTLVHPPDLLRLFVLGGVAIPCTCSIIMRRAALEAIGGFEEGYTGFFYEDQMLYAKLSLKTSVLVSDSCWDYYRQHALSGTHAVESRREQLKWRAYYLDWVAELLRSEGVTDQNLWLALQRARWQCRQPDWLPLPEYTHDLLRFAKKWALRLEERAVPSAIQRRLWRRPGH